MCLPLPVLENDLIQANEAYAGSDNRLRLLERRIRVDLYYWYYNTDTTIENTVYEFCWDVTSVITRNSITTTFTLSSTEMPADDVATFIGLPNFTVETGTRSNHSGCPGLGFRTAWFDFDVSNGYVPWNWFGTL